MVRGGRGERESERTSPLLSPNTPPAPPRHLLLKGPIPDPLPPSRRTGSVTTRHHKAVALGEVTAGHYAEEREMLGTRTTSLLPTTAWEEGAGGLYWLITPRPRLRCPANRPRPEIQNHSHEPEPHGGKNLPFPPPHPVDVVDSTPSVARGMFAANVLVSPPHRRHHNHFRRFAPLVQTHLESLRPSELFIEKNYSFQ